MLLTLAASCLKPLLMPGKGAARKPRLALDDLPRFARETLDLAGMNLSTDLLAGADRAALENIRERADRARCSCLLLIEPDPQPLAADDAKSAASLERLRRVVQAAQILGCTAAAIRLHAPDDDAALVKVATRLRSIMELAEKIDLNLLISPAQGLTARPERVTELLKKVGGFRIGTYPDFQTAAEQKDPASYLHRLTPYATVLSASSLGFTTPDGKPIPDAYAGPVVHPAYNIHAMVDAIASVGYEGPLAIDYRGGGDVTAGIAFTRDLLKVALGEGPVNAADPLDAADEDPAVDPEGEDAEDE